MNNVLLNFTIVSLVCLIIGAIVVLAKESMIKFRNIKEQRVLEQIDLFARAAQQAYDVMDGPRKKEYVLDLMNEWLDNNNIKIDVKELDALIEATVYDLKQEELAE